IAAREELALAIARLAEGPRGTAVVTLLPVLDRAVAADHGYGGAGRRRRADRRRRVRRGGRRLAGDAGSGHVAAEVAVGAVLRTAAAPERARVVARAAEAVVARLVFVEPHA